MNERNTMAYEESGGERVRPPGPAAPYRFSPEELRVLQECNQESFMQRSMPLGTALGLTTYLAIQKGTFKASPRFGAFPKVTLAVVAGYFLGKISYQRACAEKLMALPNSYIGQVLRDRRDGKITTSTPAPGTSMFGAAPSDIYSDAGPGSSLDLDTDRPLFSDDTYRSDGGLGTDPGPGLEAAPRPSLSYEELRRKNRGEYADARQDPYKVDPNSAPPVTRVRSPVPAPAPAPAPLQPTNKYGDVME